MDIESKIIHTGNELLQKHLTWGNSGNMSVRNNENQMIITGSGTNMGNLTEGDCVLVNIETQEWEGTRKPSKEIPMHRAIYRNRPDESDIFIRAVQL